MRKIAFATMLLALPWLPAVAGVPAAQIDDLKLDDIRRARATSTTSRFLYTAARDEDIVIVHYDKAVPLDIEPDALDRSRAKLHHCQDATAFVAECAVARKLETQWFKGDVFGVRFWYSRDMAGNPQCYSIEGAACVRTAGTPFAVSRLVSDAATLESLGKPESLAALFDTNDEVRVRTYDGFWVGEIVLPPHPRDGSLFHLDVDSTWPVVISGLEIPTGVEVRTGDKRTWVYRVGAWHQGDFDPNTPDHKLMAQPVRCVPGDPSAPLFCRRLRGTERTFHSDNANILLERKLVHMRTLFQQYADWSVAKVEEAGNYQARLAGLDGAIARKRVERDAVCATAAIVLPMLIPCGVLSSELDALSNERDALAAERKARKNGALESVAQKQGQQWHKLHKTWAASDQTHFAALLKEESRSLDELQTLAGGYRKSADEQHQAYLDAVKAYEHAGSPLGFAEHLPLIGPEIRHIEDYAKNPSSKNLRRMLLGLAGPVGEITEGVVELTNGESALSPGETRFLTDILGAMTGNASFSAAMEEVVGDAINDLGDEAVESLRQVGLLDDRNGTEELRDLDYAGIPDLRARASPVPYDVWTAGGAAAQAFRDRFTPRAPGTTAYMTTPDAYDPSSLTNIELASGGASFTHALDTIFSHAMGAGYVGIVERNTEYSAWSRAQVVAELFKVVADPAYAEARRAYWVTSATIGQRHAALVYDNEHAVIVLNADLIEPTEDWSKYYIEELGHLVNWWRCDLVDVEPALCNVNGDVGARFRDAVLVDPSLHDVPYDVLLSELPIHADIDRVPARFKTSRLAWIDGWPSVYTIGDRIASQASFSFLMRLGLDIDGEYPGVSDEFDIEVVLGAPKPAQRGNPWRKSSNGYCTSDTQTDCNVPTMWLAISFRDAIKLGIAGMPKVKSTAFGKSGVDLSPRLVRKHGGKLPFQLSSVNGTSWKYKGDSSIYFKKFTLAAEAKIDLWKMGHAMKGASPSSTHKPELGAKAVPAEGSWTVEIATRDTADFAGWLAGDIASAALGCAGGFVVGLVTEQDPITMCHGFSDALEAVETAFQNLDKRPTIVLEGDGSVSLPSLEYKYATSGKQLRSGVSSLTGRVGYHADEGTGVAALEEAPAPAASVATNPQVDRLKTKMSGGLSKLSSRGLKPIAVFRMRANFDYGQKVVQTGAYDLPLAVVTE